MHKLMDFICDELDEMERKAETGKLTMADVQYVDTLAHAKKNLLKAEEMSEDGYSGYSRNDGRSYARRRDSMGRYSRRYSMATEDMVGELKDLMRDAPDEHTRKEFQKFISRIESM